MHRVSRQLLLTSRASTVHNSEAWVLAQSADAHNCAHNIHIHQADTHTHARTTCANRHTTTCARVLAHSAEALFKRAALTRLEAYECSQKKTHACVFIHAHTEVNFGLGTLYESTPARETMTSVSCWPASKLSYFVM